MTLIAKVLAFLIGSDPIGYCDPVDGPDFRFTKAQRAEVIERIEIGCKILDASPYLCSFYSVVATRESHGRASVRHTRGKGENGVGPMGLNQRSHRDKWPGPPDPDWCTPEASLLVAHAIAWRAWTRYQAADMTEVQAVYSGRWECWDGPHKRECRGDPNGRTRHMICPAMRRQGHDCHRPLWGGDMGRRVALGDRRDLAKRMATAARVRRLVKRAHKALTSRP